MIAVAFAVFGFCLGSYGGGTLINALSVFVFNSFDPKFGRRGHFKLSQSVTGAFTIANAVGFTITVWLLSIWRLNAEMLFVLSLIFGLFTLYAVPPIVGLLAGALNRLIERSGYSLDSGPVVFISVYASFACFVSVGMTAALYAFGLGIGLIR